MYTADYLATLQNFIVHELEYKIGETDELDIYNARILSGMEIVWPPCFEVKIPFEPNGPITELKFVKQGRDGNRITYKAEENDAFPNLYIQVTLYIADSLDMFNPDCVYCYTREVLHD